MEDAITYTHLAMGVTFLAYIILNFSFLFRQGLEVYKVAFQPRRFQLWFFRILALIIVGGLLLPKDFFPVTQFSTASYNALGDYYATEKDYKFAEIQYKLALNYEPRNHKTNYALASLALLQGDNETAGVYFRKALAKNPSEFAYEALGRSIYDNDKFFETIFVLKEGLQKFPKSGELQNNLAYLYNKSKLQDSTVIYYKLAVKNAHKSEVPASNLMAFWANNAKDKAVEEILGNAKDLKYNSYQANVLALRNKITFNTSSTQKNDGNWGGVLSPDSTLNASDFAWIYNHSLYQKSAGKSLPFNRLAQLEDNESLSEDLLFANVIQDYYQGDKLLAFQNLQLWAMGDSTDKKGKYYGTLLNTFLKKETLRTSDNIANFNTIPEAEKALKQHPLNEAVVEKAVQLYNQSKQTQKAYETLLRAISWRKDSPKLYQLYISQAQMIGMKDYAADGLEVLRKLSPTDYQRFLPTYQAKQQSIEKAGAGFQ